MEADTVALYQYSGPRSSVTLRTGKRDLTQRLIPGQQYDLPEGNSHVQALVARGHLTPVAASPAAARSAPAEAKKAKPKPAPASVGGNTTATVGGL